MFSPLERMMAWRYLRARRQEGFISVIAAFSFTGIMLGVATLIIVMSVMNGFRAELLSRILGANGHLAVYSNSGHFENYTAFKEQVQNIPGVVAVHPLVEQQAMMTANGVASGALVHGMTVEDIANKKLLASNIIEGDLKNFSQGVLIGYKMANKLQLKVGDSFSMIAPQGNATAFGLMPRSRMFQVAGIFDMGMHEYDSIFVFMPLAISQKFFRMEDTVTGLEIFIDNPETLDQKKDALRNIFRGQPVRLFDWQQANESFFNAIQVERNVMFIILTLIILVAAFNVISSMIMLVKDKGRDIAILRTMGATRGTILRIFFLTGASIGVAGTVAGSIFGLLFSLNIEHIRRFLESLSGAKLFQAEIYFLSKLPAKVDFSEVMIVVTLALVLTFLATLYPARRAARLDPVEALRYE